MVLQQYVPADVETDEGQMTIEPVETTKTILLTPKFQFVAQKSNMHIN